MTKKETPETDYADFLIGTYTMPSLPQTRDIRRSGNIKKRYMERTDELERNVIELRRKGKSFRQIADELGLYGPGSAHNIFKRVMEKDYEITKEAANAHREEQLHILDEQLGTLLDRQTFDTENLLIVDRILKILERKSKLMGLDAAIKQETTVNMAMSHEEALEQLDGLGKEDNAK